jgi:replicative DNA helicase
MSARSGFRNDRKERGDRFERDESRMDQLRVPPHSIEAEQAVLGGLMLAPETYDRVN